jgi:hypothetical protein
MDILIIEFNNMFLLEQTYFSEMWEIIILKKLSLGHFVIW